MRTAMLFALVLLSATSTSYSVSMLARRHIVTKVNGAGMRHTMLPSYSQLMEKRDNAELVKLQQRLAMLRIAEEQSKNSSYLAVFNQSMGCAFAVGGHHFGSQGGIVFGGIIVGVGIHNTIKYVSAERTASAQISELNKRILLLQEQQKKLQASASAQVSGVTDVPCSCK